MLYVSIGLFAVAAVLGLIVFLALLKKKQTPRPVVYSHGIVAAVALLLLVIYGAQNPADFPQLTVIVFAVAVIGGFYLFFNDIKKKPGPVALAVVHAVTAAAGFILLLFYVFG